VLVLVLVLVPGLLQALEAEAGPGILAGTAMQMPSQYLPYQRGISVLVPCFTRSLPRDQIMMVLLRGAAE
jgi:hypothetical protein